MTYPGTWLAGSDVRWRFCRALGLAGVGLMLFALGFSKSLQNVGMGLALLALLVALPGACAREFFSDRLVQLTGIWIALLAALAVMNAALIPETAEHQYDYIWKLSRLFLIVLTGWWVARVERGPFIACVIVIAGCTLGGLYHLHQLGWLVYWPGVRVPGHLIWEGKQFYTLLSATLLMALVVLARDLVGPRGGRFFWLRLLPWLVALLVALNGLLLMRSRGPLLALIIAIGVLAFLAWRMYRASHDAAKPDQPVWRKYAGAALVVILVAAVVSAGLVANSAKFAQDRAAVVALIQAPEAIPETSLGIRLHQWREGVRLWQQRPLFGWGPGAGRYLHAQADLPPRAARSALHHFHSVPLDLLMWTGLVGVGLLVLMARAWFRGFSQVLLRDDVDGRCARVALAAGVMFLVAGLTQTYLTSQVTWFYLAAFLGPVYGHAFSRARENA